MAATNGKLRVNEFDDERAFADPKILSVNRSSARSKTLVIADVTPCTAPAITCAIISFS